MQILISILHQNKFSESVGIEVFQVREVRRQARLNK